MNQKNNLPVIRWISSVAGKKTKYILILSLMQMIIGFSGVLSALSLRYMIDMAVTGNKHGFGKYVLLFAGILLVQIIVRAGIRFLEEYTRSEMENSFKQRLFGALLNRDYASVSQIHSEEWMNRLTSDTVVVADGLVQILPGIVCMLVKMAGAFAAILVLEIRLAYILIPGAVLLMITTYGFRKILKALHRNIQETDGKLRVFLQEHLGSLVIVKTFAKEQNAQEEAAEKMTEHKAARMKRNHFSNLCNVGFATAMNGVYLLGAVFCGYGILQGTMSYGTFVAITQLIGQVQNPLANITGYLPKYYAMLASGERLQEVELFEQESMQKKTKEEIQKFYAEEFGGIEFHNAAFTYQPPVSEYLREQMYKSGEINGQMHLQTQASSQTQQRTQIVLQNVNMEIKKGEYVAFTGTSGCGKSTLLKLFMCLYPLDSGERYLKMERDAISIYSGKECLSGLSDKNERIPLDSSWRGLFAYVPQGNQLMSGTIREIVAFGDRDRMKDEEKLRRALQIACADDFVNELEYGMDTVLGERGQGLSEGQMQRIAIARAVFSEHPILMLDEATSSLDEATERRVLKKLRTMTDKTVLIVTHRLAVLDICDKQVEMAEGEVKVRKLN